MQQHQKATKQASFTCIMGLICTSSSYLSGGKVKNKIAKYEGEKQKCTFFFGDKINKMKANAHLTFCAKKYPCFQGISCHMIICDQLEMNGRILERF